MSTALPPPPPPKKINVQLTLSQGRVNMLTAHNQGAKKVGFTASHSGKLLLVSTLY